MTPFTDPAVEARFAAYPPAARKKMLALRELVFTTAAETNGVGALRETLKWGEPAYLTAASKTGSTVRMDWKPKRPDCYALYFNCNSGLVESFKTMFPDDFKFEGKRAVVFKLDEQIAEDALAVCLAAALTYHARNRTKVTGGKARRAT